jgi:hypothetical protein
MEYTLVIKIEDNSPVGHPILLDNFIETNPGVDLNNLPSDYAWFERVPEPMLGVYEKNLTSTYEFVGNIVKDVWHTEPMTEEEKQQKQARNKEAWVEQQGFPSWTFDEEICWFRPPIPFPDDGKLYQWVEDSLNWIELKI